MELVRQCQIALMVFDKLAPEYVDGLLNLALSDQFHDRTIQSNPLTRSVQLMKLGFGRR
jgi:hypothetical protein